MCIEESDCCAGLTCAYSSFLGANLCATEESGETAAPTSAPGPDGGCAAQYEMCDDNCCEGLTCQPSAVLAMNLCA